MTARQFFLFFQRLRRFTCNHLLLPSCGVNTNFNLKFLSKKKNKNFKILHPVDQRICTLVKSHVLNIALLDFRIMVFWHFFDPHSDVAKNFLFLTLPGANRYLIIEMLTPLKDFDQKISNAILMAQKVLRHSYLGQNHLLTNFVKTNFPNLSIFFSIPYNRNNKPSLY